MSSKQCAIAAIALICCHAIGCPGDLDSTATQKTDSSAPHKDVQYSVAKDEANLIQPGWGIPDCHIGMSIDSLGEEWVASQGPFLEQVPGILYNPDRGITITHENRRINVISFQYFGDGFTPFPYGTREGIWNDATLADVKACYGEPSYVIRMTQGVVARFTGTRGVKADYVELGIQFAFIDGKLAIIAVQTPRDDFDYQRLKRLSEDRLLSVRELDTVPKTDEPER